MKTMDGNMAAAYVAYAFTEVAAIYPITPSSPMGEYVDEWAAHGRKNMFGQVVSVSELQSEGGAAGAVHGSLAAGSLSSTYTASQGLLLMIPNMYKISGELLPGVFHVSARAVATHALSIFGDHSDVMGARDAGWIQIFSENAQEMYDNTIIGMKLAERVKLPVMVIMDGFNTSHCVENLEILDAKIVKDFVGHFAPEKSLLGVENPATFGPLALQNSYFEFKIEQEEAMEKASKEYLKIAKEFEKISGRPKNFFEAYETEDAEEIIILAGSTAGTTKDVVDKMRKQGKKVGLLKINLFRPFPLKEILVALKNAKNIVVMERAISSGTYPPIYNDVVNGLYQASENKKVQSVIYGLGGRDVFAKDIEKVFEDLSEGKISKDIKYIGV